MNGNDWVVAASVDAIDEGKPHIVRAWGDEIAVYKVDNECFAISNFCTHALARLADGSLSGYLIECPVHQAMFDIRDGRCVGGLEVPDLASYDVRARDNVVTIRQRKK